MTKRKYNTIEDFIGDESFSNWVKENRLADSNFWEYWITNNPDKKEMVNEAKDIILGIQFKHIQPNQEKIDTEWAFLENKIKEKHTQKKQPNYLKYIGIAASIVLFISIGVYAITTNPSKIIHKTAYGEVLNLKLKDGSSVILNSNSSISYFENDNRKVWLEGEAFFEVDKKESTNAKFWVLTDDLSVEVYGTSFNVNTRRQKTSVFLEEGRIWLELKNGSTHKMTPGNYISYSGTNDSILEQREDVKSTLIASWKDGTITFEKLRLEDAIKKIEETYGLIAVFKDEISKNKLITGGVPITNLNTCLVAIEKSVNVRITKVDNEIFIQNK